MDALNEKMGLRLTHHDVNWCYNLQLLKGKSYYLKTRDNRVRLIQCLPESSKGLNKDFLIMFGSGMMAFLARSQVRYLEWERDDPFFFCHHVLYGLVIDMNMPSFCRSACLSAALPSGQQRRFGNYSQGGGFCKRGGQPSQGHSQDLRV